MSKRYTYSCIGYAVFSLLGEIYRIGRIEVFDEQDKTGYQVHEGTFCLPLEVASQLEDMFDELETDYPIMLKLGSMDWCKEAVAEALGVPVDKLNDPETAERFYAKREAERDPKTVLRTV